jgi:hypothetical protein
VGEIASDEEALYRSWSVFEGRLEFGDNLDDFEVRRDGRKVYRHSLDREAFALLSKQPVSCLGLRFGDAGAGVQEEAYPGVGAFEILGCGHSLATRFMPSRSGVQPRS